MSSQPKSCVLDPLPTNILKEFLLEILPFVAEICNSSLPKRTLQLSQLHAIVTSRFKKANADPTYTKITNQSLTFTLKLVES